MSAQSRGQGMDDSWTPLNNRPGATETPKVSTVFPKQVFHGLASLLIISLCALLVELNSPGIASRITNRLNFWANPQTTVSINTKTAASSYYHPVPSPFVAPKATNFVEDAPTSEPTQLTLLDAKVSGPTSEPTEFKDRLGTFMLEKGPTSEPTEFRVQTEDFLTPQSASQPGIGDSMADGGPTEEPTIFNVDIFPHSSEVAEPTNEPTKGAPPKAVAHTGEPTVFAGQVSGEPTVFGNGYTGEPTVYGQSGEPTVYGQSGEPTVYGESGEPTVYGQTGEPTLYGNGGAGAHTSEPTIFIHDTLGSGDGSEPTNEPTVFFKDTTESEGGEGSGSSHGEEDKGVSGKGAEPTQFPHTATFSPTQDGSFAPTSDPTIFPTPEPTNAI